MNPLSVGDRWRLAMGGAGWVAAYDLFVLKKGIVLAHEDWSPWQFRAVLIVLLAGPGVLAWHLGWKTRRWSVGWLVGSMYAMTALVSTIVLGGGRQAVLVGGQLLNIYLLGGMMIVAGIQGMAASWLAQWRTTPGGR